MNLNHLQSLNTLATTASKYEKQRRQIIYKPKEGKPLLKVSKEDLNRLSNIIQHSVTKKLYQNSNLKLMTRQQEYQCSLYNLDPNSPLKLLSMRRKSKLQKCQSSNSLAQGDDSQEQNQKAREDIKLFNLKIKKQAEEEVDHLSKDVYSALITSC